MLKAAYAMFVAAALTAAPQAAAQEFPTRPVTLMVGYAPGGSSDTLARLLAPHLSEFLGQPVVIENRPGANGAVGTALVANAEPDGHMLGISGLATVMTPLLEDNPGFDPEKLVPVAMIGTNTSVLLVANDLPVETVDEFVEYAKAHPGELNCGSGGIGSSPHLNCALVRHKLGLDITHIPYGGMAPALNDLMAGRIQVLFNPVVQAKQFVEEGKVRALAVTSAARNEAMPDLPTMKELGHDVVFSVWTGVVAPAGTPEAVKEKLNEAFNHATAVPEVATVLKNSGTDTAQMSLSEYTAYFNEQQQFWADLVAQMPLTDDD